MARQGIAQAVAAVLAALALSLAPPGKAVAGPPADAPCRDCLSCHQGVESLGPVHDLGCPACHLEPGDRERPRIGHAAVLSNPADPEHAGRACGPCHPAQVAAVARSGHATLARIINQTRYLWGAQARAEPPAFSANAALRSLPRSPESPRSPATLVDAFLRACCLDCHVGVSGGGADGLWRGSGCSACHSPYAPDGRYRGGDRAMRDSGPGRPRIHALTGDICDEQCLACHHGNHVGGDFYGLYERDTAAMYQDAVSRGRPVAARFGRAQHVLSRDLHAERGLRCLDCHRGAQVMGMPGAAPPACPACHRVGREDIVLRDGSVRLAPVPDPGVAGHDPSRHGRVRCSACHAQWTFGDYGLSALHREPTAGGQGGTAAWTLAWRFRRWEGLVLGVDRLGRISALRPWRQYLVSSVDRLGRVVLDSVVPQRGDGTGPGWAFSPYVPHTAAPWGRPCSDCHLSSAAAGLGQGPEAGHDLALLKAAPPIPPARLLDQAELRALLHPGPGFRRAFAESLRGFGGGGP